MFTDLAGYTSLAQANEPAALRLVYAQEKLIKPLLTAHRGRLVKSLGDGLLVEFRNALDAVECGVELQRRIHELNSTEELPAIRMRVGIHLGDIQRRAGDILGDAVNIASRIEPLAEPGGVCLSGQVYDQVRNKVPYQLESLGPKSLKGIQVPVSVYRVALPWAVAEAPRPSAGPARLAVLPFSNISPDPNDAYFADGLTEELISVLSQLQGLRVIARTSVLDYRSHPKPAAQIGAELDVGALLEGSVRKAGDRLRITVQLIDLPTQEHAWSQSYDRELSDVFAVQGEIAREVAATLKVRLGRSEEQRLAGRRAVRTESYVACLRGRVFLKDRSESALETARAAFELAITLDSGNAAAYSGLSDAVRLLGANYRRTPLAEWDELSKALADRAVELDPSLAEAHTSLAYSLWSDYQYAAAEREFRAAISIDPSYSEAHRWYASLLFGELRTEEGNAEMERAASVDPRSPIVLANAVLWSALQGRFEEAARTLEKLRELAPSGRQYHVACLGYYTMKGELAQALATLDRLEEVGTVPPEDDAIRAAICARQGQEERARSLLRELEARPEGQRPSSGIAEVYASLGDLDACFRWLNEGAFETYDLDIAQWRLDSRLESVRADPRFRTLLEKMNLVQATSP